MRFATSFIVLIAAGCWGVSVSAQGITFGRRSSPPNQLALHFPGFNASIAALRLKQAVGGGIGVASRSEPVVFTCPMPVAHTDAAKEDPMPVARGGTPEPMPVARSGCWNPLNPSH